ncbi:Bug family tripartite tricarboxylate transporter substrate binding protein [Muricoccus radiodurans]|uniref:Bug family tripartite tricarboxylate transporter substrate binding protein n=1 Tax=Muricoccus radiodurans TaxID=2231721 RepID=UPI003CF27FD9
MTPRRPLILTGLAALAGAGRPAAAQSTAVRIVVGGPAGGPTDLLARAIGEPMSATLSRPVVVENRTGASGVIGTEGVARAAPDGTTLVLGQNATHAALQWLAPRLPYHVVDSFAPVSLLASVPHVLVVPAAAPHRSLADLLAKGRQGGLTYASSSPGSASHIISESLCRRNGITGTNVSYRGAAPAATDTVAGLVDFYVSTLPGVSGLMREGQLRALAIGAPARLADFPDLPTATEAGQGEAFVDAWFGLFAPRATPAPVVERLAAASLGALEVPAVRARLEGAGFAITPMDPARFAAFQRAEVDRWKAIVELTGVRLED